MFYKLLLNSMLVIGLAESSPTPDSMSHNRTASWSETQGIREHLAKNGEAGEHQNTQEHTSASNNATVHTTKEVEYSESDENSSETIEETSNNNHNISDKSNNVIIEGNTAIIRNDEGENLNKTDSSQNKGVKILETRSVKTKKNKELNFTNKQKQAIRQLISEHIKNNPEIVEVAIDKLEQEREKEEIAKIHEQNKKLQQKIDANRDSLLNIKTSSVYGNKNGYKIMVVFYDDNCPYCRNFGRLIPDFISADSDLKVIMRPWAFLSSESREVAAVLLAASKQDKFGKLYQEVVQHSGKLNKSATLELAKKANLDIKKLELDIEKNNNFELVLRDNEELARKIGLVGTPTILLGNKNNLSLVDLGSFSPESFKNSIEKIENVTRQPTT